MNDGEVDFAELVALLLRDFDGSARIAALVRRAILRAVKDVPADDPVRSGLDVFSGNLDLAAAAVSLGADVDGWRIVLESDWRELASAIRSGKRFH